MIMILDVDVTAAGGIIKLIARKGNPQPSEPSEPSEPFEPFEPSRRRRVQKRSNAQPFYTTCGASGAPFIDFRT